MRRLTQFDKETISQAAAVLGSLGGKVGGKAKTPKKRRAARINGKLGGRPKKGNEK